MPSRTGLARNHLPLIARWKILDNLRRSLVPPATLLLLALGWTLLPGSPAAWTAFGLGALAFPLLTRAAEMLRGPRRGQGIGVFVRTTADDFAEDAARVVLQVAFMANEAYERAHAIAVTLVRLGVTRRRLLEWETTAASAARGGPVRLRAFVRGMIASPLLALAILPAIGRHASGGPARGGARAGLVDRRAAGSHSSLSRPSPVRVAPLSTPDREYLHAVARKTWAYFDRFVTAEDHFLPPDNVQVCPDLTVAHRTSPTNIGLGLLSTLAAHDLGFIELPDLTRRLDDSLTTIERLDASRRPPAQLVRHADAGAARAGLRIHRRQRQPRGLAPHAVRRPARHRAGALGRGARAPLRRDGLPVPLRSEAAALRDRLSPGRCRWPRPAR